MPAARYMHLVPEAAADADVVVEPDAEQSIDHLDLDVIEDVAVDVQLHAVVRRLLDGCSKHVGNSDGIEVREVERPGYDFTGGPDDFASACIHVDLDTGCGRECKRYQERD